MEQERRDPNRELAYSDELLERQKLIAVKLLQTYQEKCPSGYYVPAHADLSRQKLRLGGPQDLFLADMAKNLSSDDLIAAGLRETDAGLLSEFAKEKPGISPKDAQFITDVLRYVKMESRDQERKKPLPIEGVFGHLHEMPGYQLLLESSFDRGREPIWVVKVDDFPPEFNFQTNMEAREPYCICYNPECENSAQVRPEKRVGMRVGVSMGTALVNGGIRYLQIVRCGCCDSLTIIAKD